MTISAEIHVVDDSDDAIQWIARLRSHDISNQDRAAFIEWMAEPSHRAVFDELLALWEQLPQCLGSTPVG